VSAARSLVMQRTIVTPGERDRFFERARQRRAHYASQRCRYWLFEESELPGAFIEFAESEDAAALVAALSAAPEPVIDPARLYLEVEL
jgi:hypothetical protein